MERHGPTYSRRHFLGAAAAAAAATEFGMKGSARAQSASGERVAYPTVNRATRQSFGPVRQINAGDLNVGYVEAGPANGQSVILMHGWPYDIHSYIEVTPLLAAMGYRVIVPYLRGHGTTRFLSSKTPRNAQQSAFAVDIIALMDALKIDRAILAGYDWGSRTGDIVAALWPQRCKALVSVTGYLIVNVEANKMPSPPKSEWAWWYQYYFSTERGVLGLQEFRHDLAKLVWKFNSPTWNFDNATFDRTAAAFSNPDYVSIVIDNYRWRLGLAKGEPRYDGLEKRLAAAPVITVPTITIDGARDPFTPPGNGSAYRKKFTGNYAHRTLDVGHNVPQEDPQGFAAAVVAVDGL
ncbi:alpha/beta hydrolase [Streptomyces albiflavescens]|uniref:Alpha/beta hydrolase n=1 Tax=Streptomyces albiflavescens TaxID=1623582 RepID=A0A917YDF0_9ACTN|nr:alpha/beta hydrolase [Streptomyces albiflavescens]GGN88753.1 alpha/beta hydrolase [Streptomyces albiflavescens]